MALKKHIKHVAGRNVGEIILYALSTRQWCNYQEDKIRKLSK